MGALTRPDDTTAGSGLRLRNWRVRHRLAALVLAPALAIALLGTVQVVGTDGAAEDHRRAGTLARLSGQVAALTHELAAERDQTAWFVALGLPEDQRGTVEQYVLRVNKAAAALREGARGLSELGVDPAADKIKTTLTRLDGLIELRRRARAKAITGVAVIDGYSRMIESLLALHDELGRGNPDDELYSRSLALAAMARAKESVSLQRGLFTVALVSEGADQRLLQEFVAALTREQEQRRVFSAEASAADRSLFEETVNGRLSERALTLRDMVLRRFESGQSLDVTDLDRPSDAPEWFATMSTIVDQLRTVEQSQIRGVQSYTETLIDDERGQVMLVSGLVIALLLAVLLISAWMARSLADPLRRLRGEALEIVEQRLPAVLQRLRESPAPDPPIIVPPVDVFSGDEIGQVARAFDEVHREAVRLAGEEARLRGNVNGMFVSLSRRTQTLAERQLALVERLERGERDDQRLTDLAALEHLVTRMRRSSENLLVLAGQEIARRSTRPVELLEVMRTAIAQIEGGDRVVTEVRADIAITGRAVNDMVHILAELLENAVVFSPAGSKVSVSSARVDGDLMLSVVDQGIGMTPEEIEQVNRRLADPSTVDVSVSRRMGLHVVGRLAQRHGIRVWLSRKEVGGLTVTILIPPTLAVPVSSAELVDATPAVLPLAAPVPLSPPAPPFPSQAESWRRRELPDAPRPEATPFAPSRPAPWRHRGLPDTPQPDPELWRQPTPEPASAEPAQGRGAFDAAQPVGPLAAPVPTAAEAAGGLPPVGSEEEYLPIYAEMESLWFKTPSPDEEVSGHERHEDAPTPEVSWTSPADQGWQAAEAAVIRPVNDGVTAAGLPRRLPRANLVPGSAPPFRIPEIPGLPDPGPVETRSRPLSPERMRSRLRGLQQGVRKGRTEIMRPAGFGGGVPGGAMGGPPGPRGTAPGGVWERLREQR